MKNSSFYLVISIMFMVSVFSCMEVLEESTLDNDHQYDLPLHIHRSAHRELDVQLRLSEGYKPYLTEDGKSYYFLDTTQTGRDVYIDTLWISHE